MCLEEKKKEIQKCNFYIALGVIILGFLTVLYVL